MTTTDTTAGTRTIGPMLLDALEKTTGYAHLLAQDIPADRFTERPHPTINHPAFCYGHLALYPNAVLRALGRDDLVVEQPGWDALFSFDATCEDDRGQYPSKDEIVGTFQERHRAVGAILPELDDATFSEPNPLGGRFADRFPTIGKAATFLLVAHPMLHLGQVSSWRRCVGLPSAM